jgi:N-carbamoylputrescine amidase
MRQDRSRPGRRAWSLPEVAGAPAEVPERFLREAVPGLPEVDEPAWRRIATHVRDQGTDLLVLPEMPFSPWLPASAQVDTEAWSRAVEEHERWIDRLGEIGVEVVVGSRPVTDSTGRFNEAFVWTAEDGCRRAHRKAYLPDEPGFWEATWYRAGEPDFAAVATSVGTVGILICSELWFLEHARAYGRAGVDILVCPRATPASSHGKWVAGGRVARFECQGGA